MGKGLPVFSSPRVGRWIARRARRRGDAAGGMGRSSLRSPPSTRRDAPAHFPRERGQKAEQGPAPHTLPA